MEELRTLLFKFGRLSAKLSANLVSYVARKDPGCGAMGYSVILTDALAEAGLLSLATSTVTQNMLEMMDRTRPRPTQRTGVTGRLPNDYLGVSEAEKIRTLDFLTRNLETHNVRPFLAFGTLLGLVRENRFMPNDVDMDIGILTTESSAATLRPILERLGFRTTVYEQSEELWPCRLKVKHGNGITVDLVFFHPQGNHLLTYSNIYGEMLVRHRTPFALRKTEFLGINVWIPDAPEQFLTENYGVWSEPVKFYHYVISSNLTDHSLDVVKYCCKRTFYRLLTLGEYDKAEFLIDLMLNRSPEKVFWTDISARFNQFVQKR